MNATDAKHLRILIGLAIDKGLRVFKRQIADPNLYVREAAKNEIADVVAVKIETGFTLERKPEPPRPWYRPE